MVITDASKPAGTWPVSVSSQANGRKYMLAMQCSKPAATNAEIGKQLYLSVRTVESHRAHIQRKTRRTTRAELVRYALDHELIAD